jgi:hypothetical protein
MHTWFSMVLPPKRRKRRRGRHMAHKETRRAEARRSARYYNRRVKMHWLLSEGDQCG